MKHHRNCFQPYHRLPRSMENDKLHNSQTVTVLANVRTDITRKKRLVLYARVVDNNLKPCTLFVANVEEHRWHWGRGSPTPSSRR